MRRRITWVTMCIGALGVTGCAEAHSEFDGGPQVDAPIDHGTGTDGGAPDQEAVPTDIGVLGDAGLCSIPSSFAGVDFLIEVDTLCDDIYFGFPMGDGPPAASVGGLSDSFDCREYDHRVECIYFPSSGPELSETDMYLLCATEAALPVLTWSCSRE